jgi:hypothetical protein
MLFILAALVAIVAADPLPAPQGTVGICPMICLPERPLCSNGEVRRRLDYSLSQKFLLTINPAQVKGGPVSCLRIL